MSKRIPAAALLVALLLSACAIGDVSPAARSEAEPTESVSLEQSAEAPPHSDTADVVAKVLPSVVNVRVTSFQLGALGAREARGQGSGVIIDENGTILTNFHVVEGAVKVRVVFNDEDLEPTEGRVIGTAPERDLAVIRVPEDDLNPIKIGRSSKLRLGDDVVAVGFPLGLGGPTVTSGILSGEGRDLTIPKSDGTEEHLQDLLQTDAAINPGNSGGALVDAAGRLVGINTAAASAGSAENVGFAIAIDSALPVIEEFLNEPPEDRAWMGVIIRTLDAPLAAELGLDPDLVGALVTDVVPEGPAEEAGIETGDVITRIDDQDIRSGDDLTSTLADLDPGDEVTVQLESADGERTVEVTLAERPFTFPEQ